MLGLAVGVSISVVVVGRDRKWSVLGPQNGRSGIP